MRAINHALTGALIGLSVHQRCVALPAAFLSHLVLDAMPHWDPADWETFPVKFNQSLVIDAALCFMLVVWLRIEFPTNWMVPSLAAFLATSIDFWHLPEWFGMLKSKPTVKDPLSRFFSWIQWYARPKGAIIELLWIPLMLYLILHHI